MYCPINLFQRRFILHKSHLDWLETEPRPPPQEGGEKSFEPQKGMLKERITKETHDINIKGLIILL